MEANTFVQVIPDTADTPDHSTDVSSMEVEIPFIPAPQRSIKELNSEQDTIVVVSSRRGRSESVIKLLLVLMVSRLLLVL
jgi:hypothetical protein